MENMVTRNNTPWPQEEAALTSTMNFIMLKFIDTQDVCKIEKCTPFYILLIIKDLQKAVQFSGTMDSAKIARHFPSSYKSTLYKTTCYSHYLRSCRKLHSFLHTPGNQRFTKRPAILKNSEASGSFGGKDFHSASRQSCRRARISRVRRESL